MMTSSHVTALRRYLSSTDLLMSYTLRVNWNYPKHPAEKTTPTDTTSTSATTLPRRLFPIFSSLSSESDLDHCKSRRELLQCERFPRWLRLLPGHGRADGALGGGGPPDPPVDDRPGVLDPPGAGGHVRGGPPVAG